MHPIKEDVDARLPLERATNVWSNKIAVFSASEDEEERDTGGSTGLTQAMNELTVVEDPLPPAVHSKGSKDFGSMTHEQAEKHSEKSIISQQSGNQTYFTYLAVPREMSFSTP